MSRKLLHQTLELLLSKRFDSIKVKGEESRRLNDLQPSIVERNGGHFIEIDDLSVDIEQVESLCISATGKIVIITNQLSIELG